MLKQYQREQILQLRALGLSISQISRQTNISHPTITKYIKHNGPKLGGNRLKVPKTLVGFEDYINSRIKRGVTNGKKLEWELRQKGYTGSYSSLNRYLTLKAEDRNYYKKSKKFPFSKPARPINRASMHIETGPGVQAQVDWGHFGKIEVNGRMEKLYCFILIQGYSRATYIEFTTKQDMKILQECHIHAFEKLGIPQEIVYDNMKTVVLKNQQLPNKTRKILCNPAFTEFSKYYGFEIKPCHPYWPRSKGKVEARVKYVRNHFMQGREFGKEFNSLEELNEQAKDWLYKLIDQRVSQATGERVETLWLREKPFLRFPDPVKHYVTSPFEDRRVTQSGTISYKQSFYSVPIDFARKIVQIREINSNGAPTLEIYYAAELIATHLVSAERGKFISKDEHFRSIASKETNSKKVFVPKSKKKVSVANRPLSYYNQLIPGYRYE